SLPCSLSSPLFFFYWYADPCVLHSFPTRRSSDLSHCAARPIPRFEPWPTISSVLPSPSAHSIAPATSLASRGRSVSVIAPTPRTDRKSTRLNSSHSQISYAVFCLKKKKNTHTQIS